MPPTTPYPYGKSIVPITPSIITENGANQEPNSEEIQQHRDKLL